MTPSSRVRLLASMPAVRSHWWPRSAAAIKGLGPLVFHAAAKDATLCPGADIRGVLDTSFTRVPTDVGGKVPTGYGFWCNVWPENPAWKFVAVGLGNDVPFWTEFLRALAEIDPDVAVNIEHEDAAYGPVPATSPPAPT
ncbi:hypothetical protein [Streptomyces cyaneochromogenes]|uniref:hypothetical protein n=1 Tax=Streptomyces cyaneochromogenes TaxID=2496836 RepID=UPI001E5044E2|nr:hypothetical protein [Streptomyces cyaneochromogenes]